MAYGLEANRKAIDTFLRYAYEQGICKRLRTCEEFFVPELLTAWKRSRPGCARHEKSAAQSGGAFLV